MTKEKDWFRIKKYPHIGLPIKLSDRTWVTKFVSDPEKVSKHSFYPLIHRATVTRKFRKKIDGDTGIRSKKRHAKCKPRELYYANHLDACIYGYYAKRLNNDYEIKLEKLGLGDSITAYRRIKVNPLNENSPHKSSADFAAEVFNFILNHKAGNLVAITFDIEKFFDSLDHKLLKEAWYNVIDQKTLPEAEYNIFHSLTDFAFINEKQIFNECKNSIIVESLSGVVKRKSIKKFKHLKSQRAIAFCELEEIKNLRSKNLIIGNHNNKYDRRKKGIPQGTPISAVLANVYMLNFDVSINNIVSALDGIYRRYSDDMIVVCEEKHMDSIIALFDKEIDERLLTIQHEKTQIFKFNKLDGRYRCFQQYKKAPHHSKNLEYLGFEFDGHYSFLKSASLSAFYRKMKRSVSRSRYYSKSIKTGKSVGQIFQTRLYKKFTYLGANRRRIYLQDKTDPTKWLRTDRYDWGNYISYAHLAFKKLPNNKINRQIRNHWRILNKLIT